MLKAAIKMASQLLHRDGFIVASEGELGRFDEVAAEVLAL